MENRISFVQIARSNNESPKVHIHIEADRASALELLTLGTRSVMETLSISLYEYLEALMEANDSPLSERVIINTTSVNQQDNTDEFKSN